MLFFLSKGYRVIAHDRRGHGRSTQTADGHEMDTYAADVAALVAALDLKDAIHVGHSTGGGEVDALCGPHGKQSKVAKAVLIGAVPPLMLKTPANPEGTADRSLRRPSGSSSRPTARDFYWTFPIPFYGFNRQAHSLGSSRSAELVAPGHDGRRQRTV